MRICEYRDLGRLRYGEAFELQRQLSGPPQARRHPGPVTVCRASARCNYGSQRAAENLLAGEDLLSRAGVEFHERDRGGDITYHGPGQIVGYPILDLREWKRDVGAYVRGIEQTIIDALAEFGIAAGRIAGLTGVWTEEAQSRSDRRTYQQMGYVAWLRAER